MIIAIDFDGTIVEHDYPRIGIANPGAREVMRDLVNKGHQIILFTMRSGDKLQEAVNYIQNELFIPLYGVNENPTQKEWTLSPKAYAHVYIDDAALGCPMREAEVVNRPMVDWEGVRKHLTERGVI